MIATAYIFSTLERYSIALSYFNLSKYPLADDSSVNT
jgi:hypothetical protein